MSIKTFCIALLVAVPVVGLSVSASAQHRTVKKVMPAKSAKVTVEQIYSLINKHRTSIGLKPLKMNVAICKEADTHSRNMASGKVPFGHDGFDGRSDRLMAAIKGANASGENVEYTTGDAERVVYNWLHSPVHKKNIEGDFDLTGIGIAISPSGQAYYTQIFIKN